MYNNLVCNNINNMKNSEFNPFVVGKYVSAEYFCDREKETEMLKKQLRNGRNVTMIADRRLGKSELIRHLFAQPDIQGQYYTLMVDLYSTGSLAELVCQFSQEAYRTLPVHVSSWRDKFFRTISSLRVGFKLDALTGVPTFDIGLGDIHEPEVTLQQVFAFLEQADKPCVVAFDEFQQIAQYEEHNVEALLRTYIQNCKQTQFIFAGSRRHLMTQMFLSPAKPFYQSAVSIGLEPIPQDVYVTFAQTMFAKGGKQVEEQAVRRVYEEYRGITWYMQLILNELYSITLKGGICTADMTETAAENAVLVQQPFYRDLLAAMPSRQKRLLYAIAKERVARNLASESFVQKHGLQSASSVQSALRALREKDIVTDRDNGWSIYDAFLEKYIRTCISL